MISMGQWSWIGVEELRPIRPEHKFGEKIPPKCSVYEASLVACRFILSACLLVFCPLFVCVRSFVYRFMFMFVRDVY